MTATYEYCESPAKGVSRALIGDSHRFPHCANRPFELRESVAVPDYARRLRARPKFASEVEDCERSEATSKLISRYGAGRLPRSLALPRNLHTVSPRAPALTRNLQVRGNDGDVRILRVPRKGRRPKFARTCQRPWQPPRSAGQDHVAEAAEKAREEDQQDHKARAHGHRPPPPYLLATWSCSSAACPGASSAPGSSFSGRIFS